MPSSTTRINMASAFRESINSPRAYIKVSGSWDLGMSGGNKMFTLDTYPREAKSALREYLYVQSF